MASEQTKPPAIIGAPVPRVDGPLKVSGNAMYTSDFHFPGNGLCSSGLQYGG